MPTLVDSTQTPKSVSLVIIGCGAWGPNHIRNFSSLPNCRVAGIADLDQGRLSKIGSVFPNLRAEKNYQSFLDDPEVDAVVIATPTDTHYAIARDALKAGKDVLCEKPLCVRGSESDELGTLARSHGRILMVGHVFLFNPGILKLKELVSSGDLGEVQYLTAHRTNLGPIRHDVNAAFDLASHDISIFNALLDCEPKVVSATGSCILRNRVEDVVNITLMYEPNVMATIFASWLSPKKVRQITVVGQKKMVTWDDMELAVPVAIYDKGAATNLEYSGYGEFLNIRTWDGDVRLPKIPTGEPLKAQAQGFIEAVLTRTLDWSGPEFASGVVRTLEAVRRSIENQGAPVKP